MGFCCVRNDNENYPIITLHNNIEKIFEKPAKIIFGSKKKKKKAFLI